MDELSESQIGIIYQALLSAREDVEKPKWAGSDIPASLEVLEQIDVLITIFKKRIMKDF